jgi:hypothetical protein
MKVIKDVIDLEHTNALKATVKFDAIKDSISSFDAYLNTVDIPKEPKQQKPKKKLTLQTISIKMKPKKRLTFQTISMKMKPKTKLLKIQIIFMKLMKPIKKLMYTRYLSLPLISMILLKMMILPLLKLKPRY